MAQKRKTIVKTAKPGNVVLQAPRFKNEQEEADWLYQNRSEISDLLVRFGRKSPMKTKSVTIRLPEGDIELAQRMAAKQGVGYQTYIKTVLHESLKRLAAGGKAA
jgi:predicted DNA binding CopG/RHH family protein